jgi:hypothetical protein
MKQYTHNCWMNGILVIGQGTILCHVRVSLRITPCLGAMHSWCHHCIATRAVLELACKLNEVEEI